MSNSTFETEPKKDTLDEIDALRYELRQVRRAYAELNLRHEALLLDIESKAIATKYELVQGDNIDVAGRSITRASNPPPASIYQAQ
jgi:hypothetical protein